MQDALNSIDAYDGKTRLKLENTVADSTSKIGKDAKEFVPVRTGKTKKKISTSFNKNKMTGTVRAKTPWAHLVEFGAKAAVEKPKNKKALKIDQFGLRRYATKANIPVRKAKPFMQKAFDKEKPDFIKNIKGAVQP
ncbi:HK97 gp10 family phage protein [Sporomusaceae bacterium BoRhaA]|uniref:HK97 gp10 family phage protein n=1 Tax=Pelorhabdus rhamnosifermentans TaxID=2772457 RepID=UPI001C063232|nr:HK97 gp10 family phage protein [Pelorhabdus rhamnosifermentans]MBU2703879.1 HK97 gp10 family phage protein [Pelorhabdus rhamnosifermentans]